MKKSIILLAALLALPSFSNAAKQTWTSGEQLSSVRTKILANDTELYAQAATKWVTGTAYTADNQMVVYGGNIYVCATNHTAGTFATDLAAARWKFWGSDIYATIGHNHTGTYLPLTGGALSGTLELGAASTTTGNLRFYNALAPHPVGLYSIGSNYADVNFRLPGELPLAIGSLYVDTAGHMGFWGLDTDLSSTSSSDDTIPSAKATKTGLDGKEPSLGNPSTNGYVLSSTTGGTRSWIAPATGGSMTWPSTAGIPYWTSGTAWGGAYTLDTDLSSVSASDDTIPSAKATKAALDGKQATLTNPVVQANLGTNVYQFLGTPTAANFFTAITGEGAFAATLFGYADEAAVRIGIGAEPTQTPLSQATVEAGTDAAIGSLSALRLTQHTAAYMAANVDAVSADVETMMGSANNAAILSNIGAAPAIASSVDGSASGSLSAAQVSGTIIRNYGQAAADVALTLPTAAVGYNALFVVGTAQSNKWGVLAGTNDKIYLLAADGTISAGADNGYARMTAAQIGQVFACWTFQTGASAWDWQCKAGSIGTSTFAAN